MTTAFDTKTIFAVPKMDCPSEERMIRMALDGAGGIADLRFDLQARTVTVLHAGDAAPLLARLEPLGLGARVAETAAAAPDEGSSSSWSAPSASSGFAERARRPGPQYIDRIRPVRLSTMTRSRSPPCNASLPSGCGDRFRAPHRVIVTVMSCCRRWTPSASRAPAAAAP